MQIRCDLVINPNMNAILSALPRRNPEYPSRKCQCEMHWSCKIEVQYALLHQSNESILEGKCCHHSEIAKCGTIRSAENLLLNIITMNVSTTSRNGEAARLQLRISRSHRNIRSLYSRAIAVFQKIQYAPGDGYGVILIGGCYSPYTTRHFDECSSPYLAMPPAVTSMLSCMSTRPLSGSFGLRTRTQHFLKPSGWRNSMNEQNEQIMSPQWSRWRIRWLELRGVLLSPQDWERIFGYSIK